MNDKNQIQKTSLPYGIFLILLGVFIFLIQNNTITWGNFWPIIILGMGIIFLIVYLFQRQNYPLLMPGSILTIIGLLFLYFTQTGHWEKMNNLWPTFILAPGIGFILMHFLGDQKKLFWIPGTIITSTALVFYCRFWDFLKYLPIILILIGVYLIISRLFEKKHKRL